MIQPFWQKQDKSQRSLRLLLCVPNVPRRPDNTNRLYSLGLLYLKRAAIEAGWDCDLIDAYFNDLSLQETVERIITGPQPNLLGFSLHTPRMWKEATRVIQALKQTAGWSMPVVVGGHYASLCSRDILTSEDQIHFVIEGEGEGALHGLLKALAAGLPLDNILGLKWLGPTGKVEEGKPRSLAPELDRLGNISFDWVEEGLQPDEWSLITSRGCPGHCRFCLVGKLWGLQGYWRGHSPEWVVQRVEELIRQKGACRITMVDDNFLGDENPSQRAGAIASLMKARELFVPFSIMARADTAVRHCDAFRELREVGLERVFLGLESGDDRFLQRLGKRSDSMMGKAAVKALDRLGLMVTVGVIIFHPWMTKEGILSDLQYLEGIMLECQGASLIGLNELDVFGCTAVAKELDPESKAPRAEARGFPARCVHYIVPPVLGSYRLDPALKGGACGALSGQHWRLPWQAADQAAQEAYEDWQMILAAALFPAMKAAAKHRSLLRRTFSLWQIQALRELVMTGKGCSLEEKLTRARASICALLLQHANRAVVNDFLRQSPARSMEGDEPERCFA